MMVGEGVGKKEVSRSDEAAMMGRVTFYLIRSLGGVKMAAKTFDTLGPSRKVSAKRICVQITRGFMRR